MNKNFNALFQYLKKEDIIIDKNEFLFQIQSHPDHPSLLSIADTLSFFNVKNGAMRVPFSEIEFLPNYFIAILREENNEHSMETQAYFMERIDNAFFYKQENKAVLISHESLALRWLDIVLLVENTEKKGPVIKHKAKFSWFLPFLFLITFFAVLFQFEDTMQTKLFFLFPTLGLLFSIVALKDLFDSKSELLDSFCNLTASDSCASVVNSNKWNFLKTVNFSDLSLVFFASQFFGLLFFLFSGDTMVYFTIQKIALIASIPVLLLSVYYQKFVEKKWCPVCLVIISLILLELFYVFSFQKTTSVISPKELLIFGFVLLSPIMIWSALKKLFIQLKELKEHQLKAMRFEGNYAIFKNSLVAKEKVQLPQSSLILGNKESKTIITIISSPFCGHCKDVHEIVDSILEKHNTAVQIQVILKANLEKENEEGKKLLRSLLGMYRQDGGAIFAKALKVWFDRTNNEEWFRLFPVNNSVEFDVLLNSQSQWCEENDYNFTPAIFVNGYEYPQMYERKNLQFYINELIEDNF